MFYSPFLRMIQASCNPCLYFYSIKSALTFYTKKHNTYTLKHKYASHFISLPGTLAEL